MKQEPLSITDNTKRIRNPRIESLLQKRDKETVLLAEEREKELLNRTGLLDVLIDMIIKIQAKYNKKQNTR